MRSFVRLRIWTLFAQWYFMLFLKNLAKNLDKKLAIKFVLKEQINFTNIDFFFMPHLLLLGKTHWPLFFFPEKRQIICQKLL